VIGDDTGEPRDDPPTSVPPRVLVVEDDPSVRSLLAAVLAAEGYEVRCAGDGVEALRAVGDQSPALVLLDVVLPDLDGLHVLRRLAAEPAATGLPVLAVTGSTEAVPPLLGLLGADRVLVKPFAVAQLLAAVARLTGQATR
jgi:DNA-binding response OmpR family regulator